MAIPTNPNGSTDLLLNLPQQTGLSQLTYNQGLGRTESVTAITINTK